MIGGELFIGGSNPSYFKGDFVYSNVNRSQMLWEFSIDRLETLFFYCVFLKTNINFTNLEISIKNRISVNVSGVSLNLCPIQGCTARLQVGGYSLIHGPLAQVNELNAKLGFDSDGSVECEKTSSMSSLCFLLKS